MRSGVLVETPMCSSRLPCPIYAGVGIGLAAHMELGQFMLYGLGRLAGSNPSLECALMEKWPAPSSVLRMPIPRC